MNYLSIIASHIEQHMQSAIEPRLWNWGRWWFKYNTVEIGRATGQITRSPSASLMQFAPKPAKGGGYTEHDDPVDEDDAEAMHGEIMERCTYRQQEALKAYYAYRSHSITNTEKKARKRARQALAGIKVQVKSSIEPVQYCFS
jgi:hypothetical protein